MFHKALNVEFWCRFNYFWWGKMGFMFEWQVDEEISLRLLEARHNEALFALADANRRLLLAALDGVA